MDNRKTVLVNYGIASSYEDFIEVHAALSEDLKKKVLAHERRHSRNRVYSKEDIMNDFQSKHSYFKESIWFCIKHPESWINFFPAMYSYYSKAWTINDSAFLPFVYFGGIFSVLFWLLFGVPIWKAFIGYSVFVVLMNMALLAITHQRVKSDKSFIYKEQ